MQWYNHDHHHTGLGLHNPADVHYGLTAAKASDREAVLATARSAHPERFTTSTTPKILQVPNAAWINQPAEPDHQPRNSHWPQPP